jgi:hypothetical protein
MKPNFEQMNKQELRAYLLQHREDSEVVSAYLEKLRGEANWLAFPALTSVEDLDNIPEFFNKLRMDSDKEKS